MGKPRARLQAPTPARADGSPGFLGGKLIVERKAPSAPEHRNWRGSCSDLSPRRQQPRMDHPQVPLTSGETSATDQPAFRSGRVRTRGGPPGPRRAQAIGGHARDISSPQSEYGYHFPIAGGECRVRAGNPWNYSSRLR